MANIHKYSVQESQNVSLGQNGCLFEAGTDAISGKKIPLDQLNYWNVDEQEAYFSYVEASKKRDQEN